MMRSLYSGVTGLKSHQTKMDVIGNNIANVNTVGFKSGRVLFQEVFNQTLRNSSTPDPATGRGGTNPMQIGLGLGIGAIDTVMTRGTVQRTDNPLDLSIEGEGFFIVRNSINDPYKFSRAGNFMVDKLGNVVTPSGQTLYGWNEYQREDDGSYKFKTEKELTALNIFQDEANGNKRVIPPKQVSNARFSGNLDASNPIVDPVADPTILPQMTVPLVLNDSLGNEYPLKIEYYKTKVEEVEQNKIDTSGNIVLDAGGNPVTEFVSQTTWTWNINSDDPNIVITQPADNTIIFDQNGMVKKDFVKLATNPMPAPMPNSQPVLSVAPIRSIVGAATMDVTLDFRYITMDKANSSVKPDYLDGYKSGNLVSFNIGNDGVVTGIYSNGQQKPLGLIGLAVFENPSGLSKVGENLFSQTTNSGEYRNPVKAGTEGAGALNAGTLEMSNVDLSKEFTEMIVTQRGFQANSRIITATDEMLQELMNIKR